MNLWFLSVKKSREATFLKFNMVVVLPNILAPEVNACKKRKLKFSEFSRHTVIRPKPRTGIRLQCENYLELIGFLFFAYSCVWTRVESLRRSEKKFRSRYITFLFSVALALAKAKFLVVILALNKSALCRVVSLAFIFVLERLNSSRFLLSATRLEVTVWNSGYSTPPPPPPPLKKIP